VVILSVHTDRKIVRAIDEVRRGNFFLSPEVSGYLVERIAGSHSESGEESGEGALTPRQREILALLCDGLSEKQIAYRLQLSCNGVHTHKHNLMKRLDIHSTAELVKFAVRMGLVPLDPG